jgi:hypothetical protein
MIQIRNGFCVICNKKHCFFYLVNDQWQGAESLCTTNSEGDRRSPEEFGKVRNAPNY